MPLVVTLVANPSTGPPVNRNSSVPPPTVRSVHLSPLLAAPRTVRLNRPPLIAMAPSLLMPFVSFDVLRTETAPPLICTVPASTPSPAGASASVPLSSRNEPAWIASETARGTTISPSRMRTAPAPLRPCFFMPLTFRKPGPLKISGPLP